MLEFLVRLVVQTVKESGERGHLYIYNIFVAASDLGDVLSAFGDIDSIYKENEKLSWSKVAVRPLEGIVWKDEAPPREYERPDLDKWESAVRWKLYQLCDQHLVDTDALYKEMRFMWRAGTPVADAVMHFSAHKLP
tara:strand:+ start:568 stop:975 length:408 start_codon:yes stop_codon:yes gene_type:complete